MAEQIQSPPPYSGYPPHGPPPPATVVLPGAVVIQQMVGPNPTHTTCRACHQDIVTRIERNPTTRTHIFAALLCIFGCWPFVCIPYCVDSCLSADHYCSNCGAFVGSYIN